ncbi:hypothetical protein CLIM01_06654 [Colletotrichum limetticola]|uniref:Uncharacterized protein n=1 Tax=Colletotrichum limetticola TaxID=1209924 RepID=A0ABQ9PWQ0_9PEZI|nr:hypothetical protein CLIM01_06654 [Colletotrichum limetticola]
MRTSHLGGKASVWRRSRGRGTGRGKKFCCSWTRFAMSSKTKVFIQT